MNSNEEKALKDYHLSIVLFCVDLSNRAKVLSLIISNIFSGLFIIGGIVMYAFYAHCDPVTNGRIQKGDQVKNVVLAIHHKLSITSTYLRNLFDELSLFQKEIEIIVE